jgi:hypothetical protein
MSQTVIGVDITFRQILGKILMEGPSLSLSKPERPLVIKSKL